MKERTFCVDVNGKEIFIGDRVLVSLSENNPMIQNAPFRGIVPAPFEAKVLRNKHGLFGFSVDFGKGILSWEDDGDPCWEVKVLAA